MEVSESVNSLANNEQIKFYIIIPKLPGVVCYINDMLITGKTAAGSVEYLGHVVDAEGVKN